MAGMDRIDKPSPKLTAEVTQTLSLFECCICFEYITPPILQCKNSHVFCQSCRKKLRGDQVKCPSCRVPLAKDASRCGRNHALEQVAQNMRLPFPCKFKSNGCLATCLLAEKLTHEAICEHLPYKCPESLAQCQWSGSAAQLIQHLSHVHNCRKSEANLLKFTLRVSRVRGDKDRYFRLIRFNDQYFLSVIAKKSSLKVMVFVVGDQKIADQYKYKVELAKESNGLRHVYEERPKSIRQCKLINSGSYGFIIDDQTSRRFTVDGQFTITVSVEIN